MTNLVIMLIVLVSTNQRSWLIDSVSTESIRLQVFDK